MEPKKLVCDFFKENAVPSIEISIRYKETHGDLQEILSFTGSHHKKFFLPGWIFGKGNITIIADNVRCSERHEFEESGPWTATVSHNSEPETRDGHLLLPVEWWVECIVDIPDIFHGSEFIEIIERGVRIEHFFVHDKKVMREWEKLLTKIGQESAAEATKEVLRNF